MKTLYKNILETAHEGVWFLDGVGVTKYVNPRMAQMLGYTVSEMIGRPSFDFMDDGERVAEMQRFLDRRNGLNATRDFKWKKKDGSALCTIMAQNPIFDGLGEVVGAVGFFLDLTEQKCAEKERSDLLIREKASQEASNLKSEFLANMSHEIRTPINGVIGITGLLQDTQLDGEQREFVDSIKCSANALLTVINDILDFSKIEAGKLDFEELDFNLIHIIQDIEKTFKFQAKKKGLRVSSELSSDLPRFVKGDPGRLRQIIMNLMSNAIKFTPQGQVTLRVRLIALDQAQSQLRFEVSDTGIGIPKKAMDKMFRAFSQVDASDARRFGGTGLGLSISKLLVEKMRGQIGVESREGEGSTFWFTINLATSEQIQEIECSVKTAPKRFHKAIRILVAEDNPVNQMVAIGMLEKLGYRADAVASGKEAIDALEHIRYDIVLMDCQMPEMDGYEATAAIRNNGPRGRSGIPIVAMTANAMKGDREKCLAAGMNDYVTKPISTKLLDSVLQKWIKPNSKKRA
jgi:PAS domain S-box-containing protein